MSSLGKRAEQAAVVCVRKSSWERVTEMEEFVGRLSFGSRFPQYLNLSAVSFVEGHKEFLLHDCDVDWSSRTDLVDLLVHHHFGRVGDFD